MASPFDYIQDKDLRQTAKDIQILTRRIGDYSGGLTSFLSPAEVEIALLILKSEGVDYAAWGGYAGAERVRLYLTRGESLDDPARFHITKLVVDRGKPHFAHPDVLGTFLSTGAKRAQIGDILVSQGETLVFVCHEDRERFFTVDRIRNIDVQISIDTDETIAPDRSFIEQDASVASLRLDVLVSAMARLSREKSKMLIKQKKVKRNHVVEMQASRLVEEGDIISITGYGRYQLQALKGLSKKGHQRISFTHET